MCVCVCARARVVAVSAVVGGVCPRETGTETERESARARATEADRATERTKGGRSALAVASGTLESATQACK